VKHELKFMLPRCPYCYSDGICVEETEWQGKWKVLLHCYCHRCCKSFTVVLAPVCYQLEETSVKRSIVAVDENNIRLDFMIKEKGGESMKWKEAQFLSGRGTAIDCDLIISPERYAVSLELRMAHVEGDIRTVRDYLKSIISDVEDILAMLKEEK